MLTFLEFILSTIGLTIIVTQSKLFEPIRKGSGKIHKKLEYLLNCPMCFGLWSGIMVYILQTHKVDFLLYGFIGSFVSYLAYLLIHPLMDKYD
jgi:hypothetical protein